MPIALLSAPAAAFADAMPGPDLARYLLVCGGLLALVLALAWVFRRFVAQGLRRRAGKRSLQVLDVLPLGGRQKLVVVRCYDRSFLLGLGEKEVRSIAELDPPAEPAADQEQRPALEPALDPGFRAALAEAVTDPERLAPPAPAGGRRSPVRFVPGRGVLG